MQSLVFTNDNGTISVGQTAPYYLLSVTGIGGLGAEMQSQKAPFQDGSTYIDQQYNNRNITMNIHIVAADLTALNVLKRSISNIMKPKTESTLTYANGTTTKQITVYCESSPLWGTDKSEQHQQCFVSMIANNPFWVDILESSEEMAISIPVLSFDLEITDSFEFETNGINSVDIDNIGDEETPVTIYFKGPATNPKVFNETTGEYIQVTYTLLANEQLIINTAFGNKSVYFDDGTGVLVNAFGYINLNSVFFQLAIGTNRITYTCDTGFDTANVRLTYKNKFVGI